MSFNTDNKSVFHSYYSVNSILLTLITRPSTAKFGLKNRVTIGQESELLLTFIQKFSELFTLCKK